MLKSPRRTIVLFTSLDDFCFRVKVMIIESAFIHTWMLYMHPMIKLLFFGKMTSMNIDSSYLLL